MDLVIRRLLAVREHALACGDHNLARNAQMELDRRGYKEPEAAVVHEQRETVTPRRPGRPPKNPQT